MTSHGVFEHEVKIPVSTLAPLPARLSQAGARRTFGRQLEDNAVLDTPDLQLLGSGRLLRLRQWGKQAVLTFKGPATYKGGVKTRLELETGVDSAERTLGILAELGWTVQRRYQKYRETWQLGTVTVALDETPIGCFVELEGPAEQLARAAQVLGLDLAAAVAASYQELWQQWRQAHPGAPRDMLFPGQE